MHAQQLLVHVFSYSFCIVCCYAPELPLWSVPSAFKEDALMHVLCRLPHPKSSRMRFIATVYSRVSLHQLQLQFTLISRKYTWLHSNASGAPSKDDCVQRNCSASEECTQRHLLAEEGSHNKESQWQKQSAAAATSTRSYSTNESLKAQGIWCACLQDYFEHGKQVGLVGFFACVAYGAQSKVACVVRSSSSTTRH